MTRIELSIFNHGSALSTKVRELLDQFEKQERVQVNLEVIPWSGGWERMVNVALYGEGLDISEVGSTWMGDFVKMDALAQFSTGDLKWAGAPEEFAAPSWSSGVTRNPDGTSSIWSIPWSADTRVIYYRRDLLEKAGVDEQTAFASFENFEKTLSALMKSGVEIPLTMAMGRSRQQIHILASFVWKAGGGFLSPNGKEIIFNNPEARAGMKAYFGLRKFLVPQARQLREGISEETFMYGKAGTTISGTWVLTQFIPEKVRPLIGTALLPGTAWVGGTNFVVWKNCRFKREALRLIRYLTTTKQSEILYPSLGLPTRLATLDSPLYNTDPNWKIMREAMLTGRAFSTEQLWGLIETRLTDLLPIIWEKVLAEPETDLDTILDQFLPGLARRLSMTLSGRE